MTTATRQSRADRTTQGTLCYLAVTGGTLTRVFAPNDLAEMRRWLLGGPLRESYNVYPGDQYLTTIADGLGIQVTPTEQQP